MVNSGSNTVSVINTSTNTVVKTVRVGTIRRDRHHPQRELRLRGQHGSKATVSVINTSTNTVVETVTVGIGADHGSRSPPTGATPT